MNTSLIRRPSPAATIALAACLLGAVAGIAAAAPIASATDARTVRVTYRDLDLTTELGSRVLYARIESAARQVCAVAEDPRNLAAVAAAHACEVQAVAQAVSTVHSPALAAVYAARRPQG